MQVVPFVDLAAQYRSMQQEIDDAVSSVIDDTAFVRGPYVEAFEKAYAEACGLQHCVGVANGTDALYIALTALEVGAGDEVITVANSWISSSETITQCGGRVVFADIEPGHHQIDVEDLERKITPRTRGVVAVHLYGHPAEIERIADVCRQNGLFLVEDCAQSHLAESGGRKVGTLGDIATFSFYPGKNLGAYGDAGAVLTDDDDLARRARMFANHGALRKHDHEIEGINSRLDGIQAAILTAKLPHLRDWTEARRRHAQSYDRAFAEVDEVTPVAVRAGADPVYHLYVIRTPRRDALRAHLRERGIATGIHYPTALPLLPSYAYLNHEPRDFPVASRFQDEILSLPMFPELTGEQIDRVTESVVDFF